MARLLLFLLALAALPAQPQGFLDKLTDKLIQNQSESWKKESLETLASDRDPKKRAEAAKWLESQKDPAAIAALAAALSDREATVRHAAANALWRNDKSAEPARAQLTAALDDADPNVAAQAAGALQALGMKESELASARKRVLASAASSSHSRFLAARNLVGYEAPDKLLQAMLAYLEENTQRYTGSVADDERDTVADIEQALERLVKRSKDRTLLAPLSYALRTTANAQVPLLKTLALYDPKPEGWTQTLMALLDSPKPRVRYAALGQLRSASKERDVAPWTPRVGAMLGDPDASVRSEALWALGSAGGLAAAHVEAVAGALGDPDKSVRRSAARALGEMGDAKQPIPAAARARILAAARPALAAAMERDEDADVRDEAKGALRNLGDASGTRVATAVTSAPASPAAESAGMELLRARKITFEDSSFMRALSEADVDVVRAFLDAGKSASAPMNDLGPPIRLMLFSGSACAANVRPTRAETKATVKLLLERGAEVNGADAHGNTALSEAASHGCDRELMRMLLKAGAKLNAVNAAGLTPFEMGLYSGHDGLEELIAAGYRLPPAKAKMYAEGYKGQAAAQAMIRKATVK